MLVCLNRSHIDYLRRGNGQQLATTPRFKLHIPLRALQRFWDNISRGLENVDAIEIAGNLCVDLLRSVAFSIYTLEGTTYLYLL